MLSVTVGQKDRTVLDLIALAYPEGKVLLKTIPTGKLGKKCKMHYFRVYGSKAKRFLEDIKPHVKVKRSQVEMGLEFIELLLPKKAFGKGYNRLAPEVVAKREELMQAMKAEKDKIRQLVN